MPADRLDALIPLFDVRCDDDERHYDHRTRDWDAYYAVMRIERTGKTQALKVQVMAHQVNDSYATEPKIRQLQ